MSHLIDRAESLLSFIDRVAETYQIEKSCQLCRVARRHVRHRLRDTNVHGGFVAQQLDFGRRTARSIKVNMPDLASKSASSMGVIGSTTSALKWYVKAYGRYEDYNAVPQI